VILIKKGLRRISFKELGKKKALQLLTTNTTVRKINNEVCAVPFAQVYEEKIIKKIDPIYKNYNIIRKDWRL